MRNKHLLLGGWTSNNLGSGQEIVAKEKGLMGETTRSMRNLF